MKECKYFFKDLVYVDFDSEKIIGEVQGHRITKEGNILYKVDLVGMCVPETMIHKLTEEQEKKYYLFLDKAYGNVRYTDRISGKDKYIMDMQEIFK